MKRYKLVEPNRQKWKPTGYPELDAYMGAITAAKNCKDKELKKDLDLIVLNLAVSFNTLVQSKYGVSARLMRWCGARWIGFYTIERRDFNGNIVVYDVIKYERKEE